MPITEWKILKVTYPTSPRASSAEVVSKSKAHDMPSISQLIPPFPEGLPAASLTALDFDLLSRGDEEECRRFFNACKEKGFFYLRNHHVDTAAAFNFGRDLFELPLDEKEQYAMGEGGNYLGYKRIGGFVVDAQGTPDSQETWNFGKDDAFGFSENPRAQPPFVTQNWPLIRNHIVSCRKIASTLLEILTKQLNYTNPDLPSLHLFDKAAGNQMRIIKSAPAAEPTDKLVAGAHTDFGSLTVLFNNLGGLQVHLSKETGWQWVPPVDGYAIINLGDAMFRFTHGLLKSATHRVAQPPPEHYGRDRYSVVYFERPNDDVRMGPLNGTQLDEYPTTKEWIERRVVGGKIAHYKGAKEYLAGRGTESSDDAIKASAT